jgi:hypothetical protein
MKPTDYPEPSRELVVQWMDSCGGSDVVDIVRQVACKAATWGYSQKKPEPFRKPNELHEWHHVSYRKDCPF